LKFRIEDIPAEGREESFSEDERILNERLGGETIHTGIFFHAPIQARVHLSRSGRVILVKSRIEAKVHCICARCLEPFPLTLTSEFQTSLKPKLHLPPPEEVELSREDLETEFYEGDEIDVSPLVQDQVLLTLPPKVVCQENCRGLCQRCGKNLNRQTCQCPEQGGDPRFDVLKSYRVH
jgi:uncharacterized protein